MHVMEYSLYVQNVEGCMNLDPWSKLVVGYLLSTIFLLCTGTRFATSGQYVPIWRYILSNGLCTEVFADARVVSAIVGS